MEKKFAMEAAAAAAALATEFSSGITPAIAGATAAAKLPLRDCREAEALSIAREKPPPAAWLY